MAIVPTPEIVGRNRVRPDVPGYNSLDKSIFGSLRKREDVYNAVDLMAQGRPIAIQVGGICGLFADANNRQAVADVYRIKGEEDTGKPLSVIISANVFAPLIDPQKIDSRFLTLLSSPENPQAIDPIKLRWLTGTMLHFRAPISPSKAANLPPSILSHSDDGTPIMQGLDLSGHPLAKRLMSEAFAVGIEFMGVTSLNQSGTLEITTAEEAIKYCQEQNVAIFLEDPYFNTNVRGSFTIVDISNPAHVIRDGQIPIGIIEQMILGFGLEKDKMKSANHPQADYSFLEHLQGFPPKLVRQAILLFFINMEPQIIIQIISNKRERLLAKQQSL